MIVSIVFLILTVYLWFSFNVFLALLSTIVFVIVLYPTISVYYNSGKMLLVHDNSFVAETRKSHYIIPFKEVLSIKIQYSEEIPSLFPLHTIDLIYSIFSILLSLTENQRNQISYEIETETELYFDRFNGVDYENLIEFLQYLQDVTAIEPRKRDFKAGYAQGELFHFSFIDLHTDLDPKELDELI